MENEVWKKNMAIVMANEVKVKELLVKGKETKRNNLLIFMLKGRPVTGALMIREFNILSYRDAIYDLKKEGHDISSKIVTEANGISHVIWWLSEFDEEFVLSREMKAW